MDFHVKEIGSWPEFTDFVRSLSGEWAYRGQSQDWPLRTSLERALNNWEIDLAEAPAVEGQIIRDFRRRYRGDSESRVTSDTLFCLAFMQHHGAPTRLLDWTYSPFVAAKFAVETGARDAIVWCMNTAWCHQAACDVGGADAIKARNIDSSRDDSSFVPLYMPTEGTRRRFVQAENPLHLNERLIIQQGIFMCPGDIAAPFVENLLGMSGWDSPEHLLRIRFDMDRTEVARFVVTLRRMNVDSAVLFPGLDGFARSLVEKVPLYVDLARRKIGSSDFRTGSTI